MDPFTERDMIICLKAISATLNNIDTRLEDLTNAVREVGAELADGGEGFVVEESDLEESDDEGEEEKI
jgi:hypothetical protein